MNQETEGLGDLSQLSRKIETVFQAELPPRISVELSGNRDDRGDWKSLTVRVNDPEEGTVFERDYSERPTPDQVLADYHDVN